MFTAFIVKPLFNLLVLVYALLPGHNFGLALIIFTIIIRLLLWPLLKKQLHQAKAMRQLQPELKRVKKAAKGDRRQEQVMLMELYKERGINPFATFPVLIVQFIVLIGLYSGLNRIIQDPQAIVNFAYTSLQHLGWIQQLAQDIHKFDNTLFGVVDLGRAALNKNGIYWPAMLIVAGSAVVTYYQSKQLMPNSDDQRSLRTILKEAGEGRQADQAEVNAAVGRSTKYFIPVMIFVVTVNLPSALGLYWLVSGLVAFIQQSIILRQDETEMEALADKPTRRDVSNIPEAQVVSKPKSAASKNKKAAKKKRRRK